MACFVSICTTGGKLIAMTTDGVFVVGTTTSGVVTWRPAQHSLQSALTSSDFRDISAFTDPEGLNWVAITSTEGAVTTDGGLIWNRFTFPLGLTPVGVAKPAQNVIVLIAADGTVRRSVNNGLTWDFTNDITGLDTIVRVTTGSDTNAILVVDNEGRVVTSSDQGLTWSAPQLSPIINPVGVSGDATKLSVVNANGNGFASTDGGFTWHPWPAKPMVAKIVDMAASYVVMNVDGNGQISTSGTFPTSWATIPNAGLPACVPPTILRVNHAAPASSNNSGSSWPNAIRSLQDALGIAPDKNVQIWVAQGTYKPSQGWDVRNGQTTNDDPRTVSFRIPSGAKVYGGFKGGETNLRQRNPEKNVTILSGDIGPNKAYHVTFFYEANPNTTLDGFTVKDGSGFRTPNDPVFIEANMYGGGCYITTNSSPHIINCKFQANEARFGGGGIYAQESSLSLSNCVLASNKETDGAGGALRLRTVRLNCSNSVFSDNIGGSAVSGEGERTLNFSNCVFSNNQGYAIAVASSDFTKSTLYCAFVTFFNNKFTGPMISILRSTVTLINSILWHNSPTQSLLSRSGGKAKVTISHCDLSNTNILNEKDIAQNSDNVLNVYPAFVNTDNPEGGGWFTYESGLALKSNSPCLKAGRSLANVLIDITGTPRPTPPSMGAYDSENKRTITISGPGSVHVPLNVPPGERLTSVIVLAKGADGGNLYNSDNITVLHSGGTGATIKATYTDKALLAKFAKNGLIVNMGASIQSFDLSSFSPLLSGFLLIGLGGGATTVYIPSPRASLPTPQSTLATWANFLNTPRAVEGPLLIAGGGGAGSEKIDGGKGRLQDLRDKENAGGGRTPYGSGGGANSSGPGLISATADFSFFPATVALDNGKFSSGGSRADRLPPSGTISLIFGTVTEKITAASLAATGYYIGGISGLHYPGSFQTIKIGTFGGGGGAGFSGGIGGSLAGVSLNKIIPSQGGTSFINPNFPVADSLITAASLDVIPEPADEALDLDEPLESAVEIVISQDEATEFQEALNLLLSTLETASISTLTELFLDSNVVGITNDPDRQGSVIISYTTEPIVPAPVSATTLQEKEIISTQMIYDWQISTSESKIHLDLDL